MWTFTVLLWSLLQVTLSISATANDAPIVQTKYGALKGEYVRAKGKDTVIHSYLGVPFAKPPVGPLRLSAPQPAEQWNGVRDATKQPYMCMQNRELTVNLTKQFCLTMEVPEVSEDCLYLNIYTPAKPSEEAKLPVMAWIHGGGFVCGSGSMFDGHALAAYQNVVVVLIQYRLGLLGFFSTGDEHAPGNYGLLDQVAALQWVQENIHNFGGDPGSVTIFGESAGGVSVSYHILSPLSAGLFRYAIAESGTAAMDAVFTTNPLPIAQFVANASGCDTSSTKQIVDCVMRLSEEDLLTISKRVDILFKVTQDGRFFSQPVDELLQNKEFSKVPLITGITNDEGGFGLPSFFAPPGWTEGMDREYVMSLMPLFFPDPNDQWLHEIVMNEYMGATNDRVQVRDGFREMCGDILFNIPARNVAKHHKDSGAPVYMYEFQHTFNELQKKRPSFAGSDHADEIFFVFGLCFLNGHIKVDGQFTEEENKLCRSMMAYWGNFARTGSPNGPGLTPWPEFGAEAEYLGIGLEQKPGKNLKEKHHAFITQTLPQLRNEKKEGSVVQTKYGALKGELVTAKGKDTVVYSYLGVPFAKPPVGPLRFTAPQPAEEWNGVRDATKQPYMCIQNRDTTVELFGNLSISVEIPEVSEDCLYLNIYTPAKPSEKAKLPVMVWIHGGGLSIGSASICDGSVLSAYQNVVVVLIQYRLGLFGFFSTGDEHAPGNYGLLDQVAALQWVQENIHSFGGDPGSVTIFGESAGGASVSFLLLSPLSTGLFHRAIAESGTAVMKGIVGNPLPTAQLVANISGCDTGSTQKIVECLKHWPTEDVITLSKEKTFLQFVVTEDKIFLPKPVEELLQNQEFHKVPIITGVTNDEFGWVLPNFLTLSGWTDGMDKEQVLSIMASFNPDPHSQWINELMLEEYLGSSADPIKIRDAYKEMMGDIIFNIPALTVAKAHKAAGAPVYLYEFQHPPSIMQVTRPSFVGADHGDELIFVFGMCFGNAHMKATASLNKEENELCRTMMAYWGNFARTGTPNGPGLTPWPEFGAEGEYLGIGLQQKPGKNLKAKRYIFMTEKLPELVAAAQEKNEHVEL
ncbi:liver carboxylesterase [Tachysurus vachellii]|uniref:liver carboxylesterase n=1 Tax=Tachysurus vachellii TaxID=175792 RepID=UPI00296AD8B1|nr:liver carboxylesterase [Tachysurus vachellii]